MKKIILFIFLSIPAFAQFIEGKVSDKIKQPLPGVLVYWSNNPNSAVFTDESGIFRINKFPESNSLIVKYLGYLSDTISVKDLAILNVTLKEDSQQLESLVIKGNSTLIDK